MLQRSISRTLLPPSQSSQNCVRRVGAQELARQLAACALLIGLSLIAGCASKAPDTSGMSHDGVDLAVRMSANVFLPPVSRPVPASKRRVYLAGTNTSSAVNANARLQPLLAASLQERGYEVVQDPAAAHYVLLYNVLYVGKEVTDLSTVTAVASGLGGAAVVATSSDSDVVRNAGIGGLVGTLAGAVTGSYFETRTYEIVVNVQLSEREPAPPPQISASEATRQRIEAAIRDVNRTLKYVETAELVTPKPATVASGPTSGNDVPRKIYTTQVAGFASDLRLEFATAEPLLFQTMSREISGLFWDLSDPANQ